MVDKSLSNSEREVATKLFKSRLDKVYSEFSRTIPYPTLTIRNMKSRFYPKTDGSYIEGLKIIPIDTEILKKFITGNKKYNELYTLFDKVFKSELPDPEWFEKEILQNV